MPYMSEDKIASIVDRVVSRLQTGDRAVPENPNPKLRKLNINLGLGKYLQYVVDIIFPYPQDPGSGSFKTLSGMYYFIS